MVNKQQQIDAMRDEASRIQEDAKYSSKGHFCAAATWGTVHLWIGIPTAVIAGISGVSAFNEMTVLAGITAIIAAALASLNTFLNPAERKATHHNAGTKFNALVGRARRLTRIDLESDDSTDRLRSKVEELSNARDTLNEASPQIPKGAFKKARKGIEEGEASYSVDSK